jgi:hypothetical protein
MLQSFLSAYKFEEQILNFLFLKKVNFSNVLGLPELRNKQHIMQ